MSLGLLLPVALAALASVIVPLLIHLVRRPEQQIVDFPALRWLRESVRPRRRLRFEDLWLLVARLLLLTLLALLLAMPVIVGDWQSARHWVALSSQSDLAAARRGFTDAASEWRWLAPGFPSVDEAPVPDPAQPFASLLREFDANLASVDTLSVIVPAELHGLDAERLALAHEVDWRIVPARHQAAVTPDERKSRRVALRHAGAETDGVRYIRAALSAWQESASTQWVIDDQPTPAAVSDDVDWLIWLDGPLPGSLTPWVMRGGRVLQVSTEPESGGIVWRDDAGSPIASDRRLGSGHVISVVRPLSPASLPVLLDAGFPARLRELFEDKPTAPSNAAAGEVRPLQVERHRQPPRTSLVALLGLLIAAVFLVERFVATRRRTAR